MAQRWLVEFAVADSWVADGFNLTDERVVRMIESDLGFAYSHEVSAQVIRSPDPKAIEALQSGEAEPCEEDSRFPVNCVEKINSTPTETNFLLEALLQVQKAIEADRDGEDYVHPVHGAIALEELKYLVIDPAIEKAAQLTSR